MEALRFAVVPDRLIFFARGDRAPKVLAVAGRYIAGVRALRRYGEA